MLGDGFVRTSTCAHRVFDARRRGQGRRIVRRGRAARDARRGDDRPRQHVRFRGILPARPEIGGQAHHRHRGLSRAAVAPPQEAGVLGAGEPARLRRVRRGRRRLGGGRLHAHDDARAHRHGPPQSVQALQPGLLRRLLPQAAHGSRARRRAFRRDHRHHRLPVRRGADPPAPRPGRAGVGRGRRLPRHLRERELLPRIDGPRPPDRTQRAGGIARSRQEARSTAVGHQRFPLRHERPGGIARRAAVRPSGKDARRPQPLQVRRRRLLPAQRRAKCASTGIPRCPAQPTTPC